MDKTYTRINWENEPSVATPLGATNLNKVDYAVNEIDNRVIALDANKANQSDLLLDIKSVAYNSTTGVWTFTHQNGTVDTFDQNIEKIPVTFSMDENGVITMTTADGTTYTCDVGTLIKTYTFVNSGNIQFTVTTDAQGNKSVTASVIDGSITRAKLDPDYLAQIDLSVASASASATAAGNSATAASGSATTASNKALDSEAYAIGTRGGVPVTSDDPAYNNNSKYYAEHGASSLVGLTDTDISSPTDKQALVYDEESEKWVNGESKEIADIVNVYSAKNLLSYPYYQTTITTGGGITFTDNGDGTITANGTATSDTSFTLHTRAEGESNDLVIPNGKYILSGCPNDDSLTTYEMRAGVTKNGKYYSYGHDVGEGFEFVANGDDFDTDSVNLQVQIWIMSGTTVFNLTFRPMLRCASISDNTYVPYVMTNKELTQKAIKVSSTITYSEFLQMSDAQQLAFTGYVEDYASSGVPFLNLVSWSTGTDEEITAMVNAFYNNEITLDDIKSVWHVGDSRTITLSAMSATGVGESHRSQDVEMVILDFEHDDLTTAINGHTKSLVSLQQKDCLRDATVSDTDGVNNTENGYMNSSANNSGGWKQSARRTWCNSIYYNAFPSAFKSLVKSITKQTTRGSTSTTLENTDDFVWLPSEYEIYGVKTYSAAIEGSQYKYYETANNRNKLPKWNSSSTTTIYWLRSPFINTNTANVHLNGAGNPSASTCDTNFGIAPAVCI